MEINFSKPEVVFKIGKFNVRLNPCTLFGHKMEFGGGSMCPYGISDCSQAVYECQRKLCGAVEHRCDEYCDEKNKYKQLSVSKG